MVRKLVETKKDIQIKTLLKNGFFSGIGWAFGATVGFAVVSTLLIVVFRALGGLPYVGGLIASVVQATLDQLIQNSPIFGN